MIGKECFRIPQRFTCSKELGSYGSWGTEGSTEQFLVVVWCRILHWIDIIFSAEPLTCGANSVTRVHETCTVALVKVRRALQAWSRVHQTLCKHLSNTPKGSTRAQAWKFTVLQHADPHVVNNSTNAEPDPTHTHPLEHMFHRNVETYRPKTLSYSHIRNFLL